jgi:hypothetical protein
VENKHCTWGFFAKLLFFQGDFQVNCPTAPPRCNAGLPFARNMLFTGPFMTSRFCRAPR